MTTTATVPAPPPLTATRVLRRSVTRNGAKLSRGCALIGLHQAGETAVPIVLGILIDSAVATGDITHLLGWLAALVVLYVLLTGFYRLGALQLDRVIEQESHQLRVEVSAKLLDPRGLRTPMRTGDLLTVATTDADNTSYLLDYIPRAVGATTATVASAIALLLIDAWLGLAVLLGSPLVLTLLQRTAPLITRRVEAQQEQAGRATSVATDLVAGLRPLAGLGAQGAAAARYRVVSQESLRAALSAARAQGAYLAASTTAGALLACGVALLAGWFALTGRISVGELVTVIGLAQFLLTPLGEFANIPGWVAEARASAGRVAEVMNAEHVLPEPGGTEADVAGQSSAGQSGLELGGVGFGPLTALDLAARPGEMVGVVARRAADAEALATLLSAAVAPGEYSGRVAVGGRDLSGLDPQAARALLHVEPHAADLFAGSLVSNLTAGRAEPDPGLLAAALGAASAHDVVSAHPDGLDLAVAERGANLSGGQRQRVALARALLAAPPVLVLRDPTTAVDTVTEHAIAAGLRDLRHAPGSEQITVVLAASPALLAATDRVVVVDEGRVVAEGTHEELAAGHPGYREAVLR